MNPKRTMKTREKRLAGIAIAFALANSAAQPASAALTLIDQFSPGIGQLVGSGFDDTARNVWIYGSSGADLRSYSTTATFLASIARPGEAANHADIEFAPERLTLGSTSIPKGTLLMINGESGLADIYAVNKVTGAIFDSLPTSFGASDVVGAAYHAGRNTFFLVRGRVPGDTDQNRIAEISTTTGSVLNSLQLAASVFEVNLGDIEIASNGNLLLVSNIESRVLELTPTGKFVRYLALPTGVSGLSGIGLDESTGEAWVSSTSGTVYHLGGFSASLAVLANISTRLRVQTDDNILIGGFIVTGTQPKKVIVRAIGPSLPLVGKLEDPTLELFGPSGSIGSNDDWRTGGQALEIFTSTLAPSNDFESAILATLPANSTVYTAIVRGAGGGTGIGLVEVYDLDRAVDSTLANISSRGLVETGDNVSIGGFIISGSTTKKVIVRAIGPSLSLPGKLADPTLELFNRDGVPIASNDNWRTGGQEAEIIASTVPPTDDLESAVVATLPPTSHTAIVRGNGGTTGVALIEVYALD